MTDAANEPNEPDEGDDYSELDPDQITEDAIEFFEESAGEASSPASDADAPAPG
ncbi:MAG TPA: hypothetical protein VK917_01880 [Ilumatobacter sp.]|nr:hypothetical protein [Ilumatobacter sp.]